MNEKYEITTIAHSQYPWLRRIRALRDIRENVRAGDLGGFIQSPDNLSPEGDSWLFDDSIVGEQAYVTDHATVRRKACVRGSALISGQTDVGENAIVQDHAIVSNGVIHGSACISGHARIYSNSNTQLSPSIGGHASVYGEVGGKVAVMNDTVILPGHKIDNPTPDAMFVFPERVEIHRTPDRETSGIASPLQWMEQGERQKHSRSEPER